MNILIIGIGKIGGFIAYEALKYKKINKLYLLSRNQEKLNGFITDLNEAFPQKTIENFKSDTTDNVDLTIIVISNLEWHSNIGVNDRIIEGKYNVDEVKKMIKTYSSIFINSRILVVSNPVDILVRYIVEQTGNLNVFGFGISLDAKRISFSYNFLFSNNKHHKILCIGEHGRNLVPLLQIDANTKNEIDYEKILNHSFERTSKIIKGYSIPVFGPWSELENALKILINKINTTYLFSVYLSEDFCGVSKIAIGVPVTFRYNGFKVKKIKVSIFEKILFRNAASYLKESYNSLIKEVI